MNVVPDHSELEDAELLGLGSGSVKPRTEIFYDQGSKNYTRRDGYGEWISLGVGDIKRHLKSGGMSSEAAEREIDRIQEWNTVSFAGGISGLKAGFQVLQGGRKVLVTSEPKLTIPHAGEWATIRSVIEGLLGADPRQTLHFYSWLQIALSAIRDNIPRPGQALAIFGKKDSGKSFLQSLITKVLGGRSADPYDFMNGTTAFNAELFSAEHLAMEDVELTPSFGHHLKQLVANASQKLHPKGGTAISQLQPLWRVTLSLNDEVDIVSSFPFRNDLRDKVMLFKARRFRFPFESDENSRQKLEAAINAELAAFTHFLLNEFEIPLDIQARRFGVRAYYHPELLSLLAKLADEDRLLGWVDDYILKGRQPFHGSAETLEVALKEHHPIRFDVARLLKGNGACAGLLARLHKKYPTRVYQTPGRVEGNRRGWKIELPNDENVTPRLDDFDANEEIFDPVYKKTAREAVKAAVEESISAGEECSIGVILLPLTADYSTEEIWSAVEELDEYLVLPKSCRVVRRNQATATSAQDALMKVLPRLGEGNLSRDELIEQAGDFWSDEEELRDAWRKVYEIPF